MDTNLWLGILGSAASIVGIPLAVFLYLRQKASNVERVKSVIIKNLSHQIGDRRIPNEFQIMSTIKSKLRTSRIKGDALSVNEIIEDLVTEINENPLLDAERKAALVSSLQIIHQRRTQTEVDYSQEITSSGKIISFISMIAAIITIIAFSSSFSEEKLSFFKMIDPSFLALLSSAIAAFITGVTINYLKQREGSNEDNRNEQNESSGFEKLKQILINQEVERSEDDSIKRWQETTASESGGLTMLDVFLCEADPLIDVVDSSYVNSSEVLKSVYRRFQLYQLIEPDPLSMDLAMNRKNIAYTMSSYGKRFFTYLDEGKVDGGD